MLRALGVVLLLKACGGEESGAPTACEALAAVTPRAPIAVTVASAHSCVAFSDGSVDCWGDDNDYGQLAFDAIVAWSPTRTGFECVLGIHTTATSTCAHRADGRVFCSGRNDYGELGDGTFADRRAPAPVAGIQHAADVMTELVACSRTHSGEVKCWGAGERGGLGNGSVANSPVPVTVALEEPVVEAATGGHSCARTSSGALWCWGANSFGALGDGTVEDRFTPVRSMPGRTYERIFAGAGVTCAADTGGQLWCWGENDWGQLGHSDVDYKLDGAYSVEPIRVEGIVDPVDVEIAATAGMAVLSDGTVWYWGDDPFWKGVPDDPIKDPTRLAGFENIVDADTSGYHFCVVTADHRVFCSGSRSLGQGQPIPGGSDVPLEVFFDP